MKNPLRGVERPYFVKENNYTHPRETPEGFCIFYDKKTRLCRIHGIKPETCVAGPITFDVNPVTKKLEYFLKREKICPLAGKVHKLNGETLEKHLASAKTEIRRLLADIEPEALRAILKIDEPDTFKIYEEENEDVKKKLTPGSA
jgi:Fe-S-cluster containining protein